jgi:hypothetical protein
MTIFDVLRDLLRNPFNSIVLKWNWKSSLFSSSFRALVFLCANLTAGWRAATGAMIAEFIYRGISAGFYGAITQAFRTVEPAWTAGLVAIIVVPLISHSIELAIHIIRGTPKIITSVIASVCFTIVSTLFNLYAMRRGALVVGRDGDSVAGDLRRVPRLIWDFLGAPVLAVRRLAAQANTGGRSGTARFERKQYS